MDMSSNLDRLVASKRCCEGLFAIESVEGKLFHAGDLRDGSNSGIGPDSDQSGAEW